MTKKDAEPPLRIWALLGERAGDNDQVIAIAEALGRPFEVKQLRYNSLRRLGPKLLGRSLASLTAGSRDQVTGQPPPDLTISVGHRSVPVVRRLREQSSGGTRSIHIGFSRVSPGEFDLVVATPQYPNPDHANLLRLPFALTRTATNQPLALDEQIEGLPSPRRLLIVGGPTSYWTLDETALRRTLASLVEQARREGSLLVTTSPRTPATLTDEIARTLTSAKVPFVLGVPGGEPRYGELLAAADEILVTADSVAMVSDAIWTGKPVGMLPLKDSTGGLIAGKALDLLSPGRPRYPRDLRYFWRGLSELGLSEVPGLPNVDLSECKARIIRRALSVIDRR